MNTLGRVCQNHSSCACQNHALTSHLTEVMRLDTKSNDLQCSTTPIHDLSVVVSPEQTLFNISLAMESQAGSMLASITEPCGVWLHLRRRVLCHRLYEVGRPSATMALDARHAIRSQADGCLRLMPAAANASSSTRVIDGMSTVVSCAELTLCELRASPPVGDALPGPSIYDN